MPAQFQEPVEEERLVLPPTMSQSVHVQVDLEETQMSSVEKFPQNVDMMKTVGMKRFV